MVVGTRRRAGDHHGYPLFVRAVARTTLSRAARAIPRRRRDQCEARGLLPNTMGIARFSVEVRTIVDAADAADGCGAPSVDGEASRVVSGWWRHVDAGTALTAAIIET